MITLLAKEWTSERLKDVSAINASSLAANTDSDYEFDYLEISNVNYHGIVDPNAIERLRFEDAPSRARRRLTKNCTAISSVRPNLQAVAFIESALDDLVCSTGFNVVRPSAHKLTPKFAYYALLSDGARQYFEATAKGVGYPAVDDKDFQSFIVPLPPLPEQQRIAAYLDASCAAIDAAVTAKRRQLETLLALRNAIIREAVMGGVDPKAQRRDPAIPGYTNTPVHWRRGQLRYEIEIGSGDFASDKIVDDGEFAIYGGNGVMDRTDRFNVDGETVVIGRVGAYCGNAHYVHGKAWVSDNALVVKSRHAAQYLCHLFNALNFNAQANNTAQPVITGTKIKSTVVAIPSLAEQNTICVHLDQKLADLKQLVASIEAQIATLTAYRKSLIHECVTGQRRITDADLRKMNAAAILPADASLKGGTH
jgi:type I restriction enzyme S subunit